MGGGGVTNSILHRGHVLQTLIRGKDVAMAVSLTCFMSLEQKIHTLRFGLRNWDDLF